MGGSAAQNGKCFFSSAKCPDRPWHRPTLPYCGQRRLLSRERSGLGVKLSTYTYLMPTLRMSGAVPLLLLCTSVALKGTVSLDVRGSVHHRTIHKEKMQQDATMYRNFIIPYLYEAQHVSGNTPPIIRNLKLHWKPLVFYTWKVVGRVDGGRCLAQCA